MEYIDDHFGIVTKKSVRQLKEVEKGYTSFQDNDILFAKITPCMENGKCAIAKGLVNGIGFGSTEFHVIRVREAATPKWVYYYLRQEATRRKAELSMTGSAGQKRVPSSFLEEIFIPLPPLPEQKSIAAILEKADRLRRQHHYALELSNTYLQSVFLEMFGDPVTNPKGWECEIVDDICDLVRGSSPRPQGDPRYFGGPIPRLMIADISRDGIYVIPKIDSLTEEGARKSRWMKADSVVMAVSGAVGLPAILEVDACIHDGFVGFRDLDAGFLPSFFVYLLQTLREVNRSQATGAIWQNLTTDQIKDWKVIHPPTSLQENFDKVVQKFERIRAQQREAERQAEHLFQTLLHQAFEGNIGLGSGVVHDEAVEDSIEASDVDNQPAGSYVQLQMKY